MKNNEFLSPRTRVSTQTQTQSNQPDPIETDHRDQSKSSSGRRRVTKPRNQVRQVGWLVLSSKTRINRPDQRLTKIRQFKLFSASSWSNYLISNEIYAELKEIFAGFGEFLLEKNDFDIIFHCGRPNRARLLFDADTTLSSIGGGSELSPLDSIGSIASWVQTRPGLTHGHPNQEPSKSDNIVSTHINMMNISSFIINNVTYRLQLQPIIEVKRAVSAGTKNQCTKYRITNSNKQIQRKFRKYK